MENNTNIIGITTCVGYGPILELTIPSHVKTCRHVYVVTKPDDTETINICKKYNKVSIVFNDFKVDERWIKTHERRYKSGEFPHPPDMRKEFWPKRFASVNAKSFNKGGGINAAQKIAAESFPNTFQLVFDCDISLPIGFNDVINQEKMVPNKLYVPRCRRDYKSLRDYNDQARYIENMKGGPGWGFFQLYRPADERGRVFYDHWPDAAKTDVWFRNDVIKKDHSNIVQLKTHVDHLGAEGKSIHYKKFNFNFNK